MDFLLEKQSREIDLLHIKRSGEMDLFLRRRKIRFSRLLQMQEIHLQIGIYARDPFPQIVSEIFL
jgi:hypothetical protein